MSYLQGLWSRPDDDVWRDGCRFFAGNDITCDELCNHRAQWLGRLDADRRALAEAIQPARMLEKEDFAFTCKAAWLNSEFFKLKKRVG